MVFCPNCCSEVQHPDRFCRRCGFAIPLNRSGAENRYVTVLCTDMSGYTALAENLDPEDLRDCMGKVISEISRIIAGYGGTVEKYIGDAVVAIFGLHRAREDDSLRAVLAALRIHRTVDVLGLPGTPVRLRMHTGINAGEVIVDFEGCATSPHGALGKPINIASRLCDLALDGEILIGESLAPHVIRHFCLEWKGNRMLKGSATPINVYKVLDEKKIPVPVHRDGGLTSPLVGREHERSILLSRAHRLGSGRGGVICINGDAGIGKSRLIQELKEDLRSNATFLMTSCHDHTKAIPYFPFFRLVQLAVGLTGMGDRVCAGTGWAQNATEHGEHVHPLGYFIKGVKASETGSPVVLREKICDAVLGLFRVASTRHRLIICIEDIHWADQSTHDLLEYLVNAWERDIPGLMILTHRTDWTPGFSVPVIRLRELPEAEVGRMICHMLGQPAVADDMVKAMAHATGGNPFFLEEMVNYLLEKGFDISRHRGKSLPGGIPSSVHALISSRMDNLDPSSRRVLQEASLIGRIFQEKLLSCITSRAEDLEASLHTLMRLGFIHAEDSGEYAFRHDIIREVAGRSLLKKERISIHLQIARFLEESSGQGTGDISDMLAHHYTRAQEYEKALRCHLAAADHCRSSGAWVEAADQYLSAERILESKPSIPGRREMLLEIREGIWSCSRVFNPVQAIAALDALTGQYRSMGMKKEEAYSFIRLINLYSQLGNFEKAFQSYEYGLSLCGGEPVLTAAARTAVAYTHTFLGSPLVALELLEASRSDLDDDRFLLAFNALSTLAATVWKADMRGAEAWYARTKELCREYLDMDLMADIWLAHICYLSGRFEEAGRVSGEISMRERKLGRVAGGSSYLRIQASIYFRTRYLGDIEGARSELELFDALEMHIQGARSMKWLYKAWIALDEGRAQEAHDLLEEALPGLREGIANRVPYALNALSEAKIMLGDAVGASLTARECIEWNERSGNMDQLIWALRIFADASVLQNDAESAHHALSRALRLVRVSGMKPHLAWVFASCGNLLRSSGDTGRAERCYIASKRLWEKMGNTFQAQKVSALHHGPKPLW